MKPIKQLSNLEMWEIISKEYIGTKEICLIGYIGESKAQLLRREIEQNLKDWILPKKMVPTKYVLEKLNINKNDVFKKAKMERELSL